jgi:thioesterase domain-containing protein
MRPNEKKPRVTGLEQTPSGYSGSLLARRRQFARAWLARMRSGSLIELKRGSARALFLVHDGEGETLVYLQLARHMPADLAVFSIEPRAIGRIALAHTTIEDMAAFYIEQMRKKQPRGPYVLGGLCAGGVIAYEMAAQLLRAGETVDLVLLMETAAPKAAERPGRKMKLRMGRVAQAIEHSRANEVSLPRRVWMLASIISLKLVSLIFWEVADRWQRIWVRARFRLLRVVLKRNRSWPKFVPGLSVRQTYESAHDYYVPRSLSGAPVVLVRATSGTGDDAPNREIYVDETFGWNLVAGVLMSVDVDGGHSSMLQEPFVASVAKALIPYLQSRSDDESISNANAIGESGGGHAS